MFNIDNSGLGKVWKQPLRKRSVMRSGGSFIISWGRYGGWYWYNKFTKRLCLGRLAITFIPMDIDDLITEDDAYSSVSNGAKSPVSGSLPLPIDAHSIEVFAIKDSENSPTGKEAFIGYKIKTGCFHFISVPYSGNDR